MKRIILTSLFFCLTITTILAQVTPDGNTTTSTTTNSGGFLVINIAAPVSGVSNNTYSEFNVSASGIDFNNDTSNPNITDGNFASIILNQVTSNSPSLLEGRIQVAGHGAKIIIANPNGITCNGCEFISTRELDLVTGTYNIATGTYSISDNDITLGSGGLFLDGRVDLNIQTNNFNISGSGEVTTDTFNLNLAGDFNNSGTILVYKSFNITATDFNNSGTITVNNDFGETVDGFDITATNFNNSGSITTESLNITTDYTAINQGSIASNSLDITANDFFRNLTGGDISVDSLNITAGGKVTNTANINVAGTLSITANNDSTRTDDPAGAFFYVSNRGNITADNFVITAVDNFYNRGNITTTSGFNTGARNIFFFNEEIDSFTGTYDGGTITLGGDSSFIAGGAIENYGNIDLTSSNNLDITANSFTNHAGANVTADTLNLTVNSFINDGSIDAIIIGDTNNQ